MGLYAEVDFINDWGFPERLTGGDATIGEASVSVNYSGACSIFVETFMEVAKELVPVDTGYLRSTLKAEGYDTYCYAETDCEYAQSPEFGTWCQAEQPYFRPALEQAIMAAKPYWDRAQQEALIEEEMILI